MAAARLPLIALLVSSSLLSACKKGGEGETQTTKAPPAPPVKVTTTVATAAPTPDVLTLTGMIAADQRSEVTADTQGKVLAVMVERGQRVKMGAPVVQLDVRNAALSAREASANLETARAQKSLAEEECRRTKALLDKGAITKSEYDRQTTSCQTALQSVSAAEARSAMIAKSVSDGVVRAPFDGEVAEKSVSPGEWVAPGRALFTLVDDDPLRVELSVPEVAIGSIQKGQTVKVHAVAVPGYEFTATVTRVGAEIGKTRSLIVEATIDPKSATKIGAEVQPTGPATASGTPATAPAPGTGSGSAAKPGSGSGSGSAAKAAPPAPAPVPPPAATTPDEVELKPGMFAEARVTIGQVKRPVLPETAVVKKGKTYHAFVVAKGELEERIVQLGATPEPGKVSIAKGIDAGEHVVTQVTDQLIDGAKAVE